MKSTVGVRPVEPKERSIDLPERARDALAQGSDADDETRMRLLEELYKELEQELERDIDPIPPTRR